MQFSTSFILASIAALATTVAAAPLKRDGDTHTAQGTWYTQNGVAGSCGTVHSDSDYIVAVSAEHHSAENCGKTVTITANGVTNTATIADTCEGCGYYDLDMSTGLFETFASLETGEITIDWAATWY